MTKKKILAYLIAGTSLITIASIGITLAYYSAGINAKLAPITITLKSEPRLNIATVENPTDYKTSFKKDELYQVDEFNPVSSCYSDIWKSKNEDVPKFAYDMAHYENENDVAFADSGFYQQEFYALADETVYVTVDTSTPTFEADEAKNEAMVEKIKHKYRDLSDEEILANLNNLYKSLRLSVYIPSEKQYVILDEYKTEDTYLAGVLDTNADGYFDYDNMVSETMYGDYDETKIVFDEALQVDVPYTGSNTCFNAAHKASIKPLNFESSKDGLAVEDSCSKDEISTKFRFIAEKGVPIKFVISIYIEGWDLDCTSLAEFASFTADVKLRIQN